METPRIPSTSPDNATNIPLPESESSSLEATRQEIITEIQKQKKPLESINVNNLLYKYPGFDAVIASELINAGEGDSVVLNLENFQGLNNDTALALINAGEGDSVVLNLENFQGLDHNNIVRTLIKTGYGPMVDWTPESFNFPKEVEIIQKNHHLKISEAFIYYDTTHQGIREERVFEKLHANIPEWQDEENIASPFREGAAIFGEDKMFLYLDRKGLSRHEGLHQFKKIIELYHTSHLSPSEFYNNILNQVSHDESEYYAGTAYHHLNAISTSLSLDFEAVHRETEKYRHINKLQELSVNLQSPAVIFNSWKNLKKYKEIQAVLAQKDILEQLVDLENYPDKAQLKSYIETLAFHPNISMDAIISFWRTPEDFLELSDSHTEEQVHNRKKPSNYIEFPHLDLSAEDLRNALVEGSYDRLQSFHPFVIEYALAESTVALLNCALGKRSEGKSGEAKNPPKLFKALQDYTKQHQIDLKKVLTGELSLSTDHEIAFLTRVYDSESGLPRTKGKQELYRAKINKKSDPDAVVAGNDTACCMPFGSGKNNIYTFNPNCSLFTLQKKNTEGVWRTIAQSVLTEDMVVGKRVSDIISEVEMGETRLNAILPDDVLRNQQSYIACDNIEVAENFKGNNEEIKIIYQDFFREYLKQCGTSDHFETSKVIIGQGYSDALTDLPQEPNVYLPRAPVGYSDKLGDCVYSLSLHNQIKAQKIIISRTMSSLETPRLVGDTPSLPRGVAPLTFRDTLPVSYIEGKAYTDNESLIEYLHNMENALIAKDVNNIAKHRPNMSFKYVGDDNKIHGYLLAYEGKVDKEGEPIVYVSDLASDGNRRAGGSLILGFTESYKHHYLDQNNALPIYAQMREKTSYPIIKKQLDTLAQSNGISFEMEEIDTYEVGDDTMHTVMIRPITHIDS